MATDTLPTRVPNDRIVGTYDRIATLYDWFVARLEAATRAHALWALGPSSGERILEIGCGGGQALVDIADSVGPGGRVVGLDASPRMVERARDRIHGSDVSDGAAVTLGDARSLPFKEGTCDAVYMAETLELFSTSEMTSVLDECRRVLRADGRLVVASMDRAGWEDTAFVRGYEWVYRYLSGYASVGCRPIYVEDVVADARFRVERSEQIVPAGLWPIRIVRARPA
ncbi:MAG: ubiquinone/menaquinone biosynthesis C-methylase UbiE [Halobacteriales archaeon]|jgi:ubiquinone/menaquinone biosynthesis C-methylase UbiE